MSDWLRFISMIFYAPLRGMREVRDRGGLLPAFICAYVSQVAYFLVTQWLIGNRAALTNASAIAGGLFNAATLMLPIALILIPVITLVANFFDRRGSFSVVLQQEYAVLTSVVLYSFVATNLIVLLIALFLHFSGIQAALVSDLIAHGPQTIAMWRSAGASPALIAEQENLLNNPMAIASGLLMITKGWLFVIGIALAVREVFRPSILRTILIVLVAGLIVLGTSQIWGFLFTRVVGSPFLLLFLFFLLRGYFTGVVGTQHARAAFKQNLEAATINPRDSSAHYNLGLIHQNRGELDQARERFQRAIEIDPDEVDAHYQLGRIARAQNRLAEAISHFEQVVQRDQYHAQNEIWREIGATYVAAGQFADGRDALEKFLNRRENDPQGLYLIGRAHAGLGDSREAATSMQACIDAVKTAPAYKYRAEKRWLHEAQQFLKGKKREAVGTRQP
jgi:tetratricopeptide (TPR) repeat protein